MHNKGNQIIFIIALMILAVLFTGCGQKSNANIQSSDNQKSANKAAANYGIGQKVSGGVSETNVNLKSVSMQNKKDRIVLSLSFLYGSKYSGVNEAVMDKVPRYEVVQTNSPYRLQIQLEGVSYWDWENSSPDLTKQDLISGLFHLLPSGTRPYVFYVQLGQEVTYSVVEKNDGLEITLYPAQKSSRNLYYAAASCFYEFQDGKIPSSVGLTPVLCQNQQKAILISQGFSNKSDAEAFLNLCLQNNKQMITNNRISIVELKEGQLPTYDPNTMADIQRAVIKVNGQDTFQDPVMIGGTYLCATSDGSKMVFSQVMQQNGKKAEELWIVEVTGRKYRLNVPEFNAVSMAIFSPDDTKLAILEDTGQERNILLLDMQTNELSILKGEGLGTDVSSFVWNDNSQLLYVLIGQTDTKLVQYSLTKPSGSRITNLIKTGQKTRGLVFLNGYLYYMNPSPGTTGEILKFHPGDNIQQVLTWGSDFCIAPDGTYLALLSYHDASGRTSISIRNLAAGEEKMIEPNTILEDYGWTKNGSNLYYLKLLNDGTSDSSIYVLYNYDTIRKESREVFQTYAEKIYLTGKTGKILLVDTSTVTGGEPVQVSYLVNISGTSR